MQVSLKSDTIFIVCRFGAHILNRNHRITKYFYALNKYVPKSKVVLAVSEYTKIETNFTIFPNLTIIIEKYGNETIEDIKRKYGFSGFYFNALRYSFYYFYLQKHSEVKYVIVSDDDTLFIKDPFILIAENPNEVHIMEDIFPFSRIIDGNYIWTNSWAKLKDSTKIKCGLKFLNKSLLSKEVKDLIPLNCGLMIGRSKNLIEIFKLMSRKFKCVGMFPNNAEQGLLNYLDLSGELKELGFPIHRHNIFNGSLLSCPGLLPIKNYTQQINSEHIVAVHHYQLLKSSYIEKSPYFFQNIMLNTF